MGDFTTTIQQGRAEYREAARHVRVYPTAKAGRYDVQADLFSGTDRATNWRNKSYCPGCVIGVLV